MWNILDPDQLSRKWRCGMEDKNLRNLAYEFKR